MELVEGNRGKRVRSRPNCRISDNERQQRQFHAVDVNRYLEFDSGRYLRLLCRRGFIVAVYSENKRIAGYTRSESAWPPPREFFERGAFGLAYYISMYIILGNEVSHIPRRLAEGDPRVSEGRKA